MQDFDCEREFSKARRAVITCVAPLGERAAEREPSRIQSSEKVLPKTVCFDKLSNRRPQREGRGPFVVLIRVCCVKGRRESTKHPPLAVFIHAAAAHPASSMRVVTPTNRRRTRSPGPSYDVKIVAGRRVVVYHDKEEKKKAEEKG